MQIDYFNSKVEWLQWQSVQIPLMEASATKGTAESGKLHTRQPKYAITHFHVALRASPARELPALETFDVGVVVRGC